jgi:peptidoglycan/LPS O-acetylase OafA/YrhL
LVLATHYARFLTNDPGIWGFASTGVDLFFVLSGYVFAPYLLGQALALAPHLIRRFFRLYPLYLCALLLYVALHLPAATAWEHFGVHLFMGHTLTSLAAANFYNAAFWSLPPEVEYYLLLPLLAWGAGRWRWVWTLLFAAALHLLLVLAAVPNEGVTPRLIATIHLPGLLVEFMLGTMAYVLASMPARWLRLSLGALVLATVAALYLHFVAAVNGVAQTPPQWVGGNIGLGAALGYALVVSALAGQRQAGRLTAHWLTPWLLTAGELSYGVYLLHNATPQILARFLPGVDGVPALLLCTGLTLLLAWGAHHAVEKPLRNFGRGLSQSLLARSK